MRTIPPWQANNYDRGVNHQISDATNILLVYNAQSNDRWRKEILHASTPSPYAVGFTDWCRLHNQQLPSRQMQQQNCRDSSKAHVRLYEETWNVTKNRMKKGEHWHIAGKGKVPPRKFASHLAAKINFAPEQACERGLKSLHERNTTGLKTDGKSVQNSTLRARLQPH